MDKIRRNYIGSLRNENAVLNDDNQGLSLMKD